MNENWVCIDIICGADAAEILASELAEAFGVSVEFISGGLRMYLAAKRFAAEKERLGRIVDSVVPQPGEAPGKISFSEVPDEDWSRKWKEHFKPLSVGRRFLVTPTWEEVPRDPERLIIRIDPGRAFGTGHHETTRLCLEWLESCLLHGGSPRGSLLDVGTGSGILAIGAALLGFDQIVGVDNDPEAVETAKENVLLNGLSGKIRLLCSTPEEVEDQFDVVVSNIESGPLIRMARTISSRLREGGRLGLSGILAEQADQVCAEYEKMGLAPVGRSSAGEWVLLAFAK
ncbi:MAG: 50S ribosomal protein L11 methyltransferase [Syntrophobacteraceae bacterium]|nr:50S ribosomal protein L11 methyltransferase [Syntrophobacteraceae bacterium]